MKVTHELKIWPEHYARVINKTKTFEIRSIKDRVFQKGDKVVLKEFDPERVWYGDDEHSSLKRFGKYTGTEPLYFKIGDVYPIDAERVVFSLLPIGEE